MNVVRIVSFPRVHQPLATLSLLPWHGVLGVFFYFAHALDMVLDECVRLRTSPLESELNKAHWHRNLRTPAREMMYDIQSIQVQATFTRSISIIIHHPSISLSMYQSINILLIYQSVISIYPSIHPFNSFIHSTSVLYRTNASSRRVLRRKAYKPLSATLPDHAIGNGSLPAVAPVTHHPFAFPSRGSFGSPSRHAGAGYKSPARYVGTASPTATGTFQGEEGGGGEAMG